MLEGGYPDSDSEWHRSEMSDVEDAACLSAHSTLLYPELREAKRADAPHVHVLNSSWLASGKCELERLDRSMITFNGTMKSMFHECDGDACSGSWSDTWLVVTPPLLSFLRETHRRCRQLERLSVRAPTHTVLTAEKPVATEPPVEAKALMKAQDLIFEHKESFTEWEYVTACNALKRAFDAAV